MFLHDKSFLKDVHFICYGVSEDFNTKENMLWEFNKFNSNPVDYCVVKLKEITDDYLHFFSELSQLKSTLTDLS